MKTELFGGSKDGMQIKINGYMPNEILIPEPINLTAKVPENYDPRQMLTIPTLSYKLDIDGKYKAEDMSK
jgi:hypothetical protein